MIHHFYEETVPSENFQCGHCGKIWVRVAENPIIICPSCNHHEHIRDILQREQQGKEVSNESTNPSVPKV